VIACGYVRVSSRAQSDEMQRHAIEQAAAQRGDTLGHEMAGGPGWYAEKRSAKTTERPELRRLLSDAAAGLVVTRRIYVFKLDRLCRTGVGDTFKVLEAFKASGSEVVAVADNIHLRPGQNDVTTDVLLFALGLAAQLERQAINERIAAARERMDAAGKAWGRPRRMTVEQAETVHRLRAEGRSLRKIAMSVGAPLATVRRELAR
jgi:DNA invertase Pin-like site-specific DNA recombinase